VENLRSSLNTTNKILRALKEGRYVSTAPYGFKNVRDAQNTTNNNLPLKKFLQYPSCIKPIREYYLIAKKAFIKPKK
jgi:hypothetical protein